MNQRAAGLDAIAQAELVHRGELQPVDLVDEAIERLEKLDTELNAVVFRDLDRARDAASRLDPALPFAGVPILVKDLFTDVAGLPSTCGSAWLRDRVSRHDQTYVARLKRAGFVVLGKTRTPEFGMQPTVESRAYGTTRNPWAVDRSPGGSSGASAAAVASGMVPVAHGNDAGGSLRIPAAACGVFGLKPTRGRNPEGPAVGESLGGLAVEHVLTRSVRDSAALLDVTSGPALGDPYWTQPHEGTWLAETQRDPGRLRVAVTRRTPEDRPVDPACLAALEDTVALLESLGHHVFERDLDELTPAVGSAIGRMYGSVVDWCVRMFTEELGRPPEPGELEPLTRLYWERSRSVTGGELLQAQTTIHRFGRAVAGAMTEFDAWLSPTLATLPPLLGAMQASEEDPTVAERVSAAFVAFPLVAANLAGAPAMSVPLWWTPGGLPVGVHLMGRYGDEATLLRLAAQLERAQPWADRWPPVSVTSGQA